MKELSAAMAKAFPSIEGAIKGRMNPHFRSKYADLGSVTDAIKPALAAHGLFYRQVTHLADHGVCVETVIHHESGESLSCGMLFVPASKDDPQGYGSALSYARRYSLMAAFGVPPQDDDGNAASARPVVRQPEQASKQQAEPTAEAIQAAYAHEKYDETLEQLRGAAMEGTASLNKTFAALNQEKELKQMLSALWHEHRDAIKEAAAKVDSAS